MGLNDKSGKAIREAIERFVKSLVRTDVQKAPFDKTKNGRIVEIKPTGYTVEIENKEYPNVQAINGATLNLNDIVVCRLPNNQMSQIYIEGKLVGSINKNNIEYRPNLLINPDFSINQRGATTYTGSAYSVDRWLCSYGTLTVLDNGIKHTSANTWQGVAQYIENPSKLAGKTLTVSANGRAGSGGIFRIYLYYQYSGQTRVTACTANTQSTTNTTISATGTIPSNITDNDKVYVMLYNSLANVDFYCNWAKLEVGDVATPYSPPLIAEELPKCQRYYEVLDNIFGQSGRGYAFGGLKASNEARFYIEFKQSKRTVPTMAYSDASTFVVFNFSSSITCTTIATVGANKDGVMIRANGDSFGNTGVCVSLNSNGRQNSKIIADAEIY